MRRTRPTEGRDDVNRDHIDRAYERAENAWIRWGLPLFVACMVCWSNGDWWMLPLWSWSFVMFERLAEERRAMADTAGRDRNVA